MIRKVICCKHVLEKKRKANFIVKIDFRLQLLCDHDDCMSEPHLTEFSELLEFDSTLNNICELKNNHCIKRDGKLWIEEYYYDMDTQSIKVQNDKRLINTFGKSFEHLPILDFKGFEVRSSYDVKCRALALSLMIQFANNLISKYDCIYYIEKYNLKHIFTIQEYNFIEHSSNDGKIFETWKVEALVPLLWYLGIEIKLENFFTQFDLNKIDSLHYPIININIAPSTFLENKFFTKEEDEVLLMLDLYSRLDYIADISRLNNDFYKQKLNTALIYERRYSLMWLSFPYDWDKIKCNSIL